MAAGRAEHATRARCGSPAVPRHRAPGRRLPPGWRLRVDGRRVSPVPERIDRPGRVPGHAHHRRRTGRAEPRRSPVNRLYLIAACVSLVAVLLIGVPPFLRTPVWVDVTYHDLSAWNVLHGGVHYRDVFETNLPGMVWLHCLVRPVVGWSHEAIRIVDLVVIGSVLLLLTRFLKQSGIPVAGRVWFLVAAAVFYLFETEFIHCQRDGWMMLPAVAATWWRVRRVATPRTTWLSVAEGVLWGCAVWIKPHFLVPALLVWLISLRFQSRRDAVRDALGLVSGGL